MEIKYLPYTKAVSVTVAQRGPVKISCQTTRLFVSLDLAQCDFSGEEKNRHHPHFSVNTLLENLSGEEIFKWKLSSN